MVDIVMLDRQGTDELSTTSSLLAKKKRAVGRTCCGGAPAPPAPPRPRLCAWLLLWLLLLWLWLLRLRLFLLHLISHIISACVPCNIIYIYIYIMARDGVEKSWSIGSEAGGEEVCAYNEDDVPTVDKIRLRWQVCDGTEGFSETRSMRLKAI